VVTDAGLARRLPASMEGTFVFHSVRGALASLSLLVVAVLIYQGPRPAVAQTTPSGPSIDTLAAAALTVDEAGPGFAVQNQGPTDDNIAYVATYSRGLPNPGSVGIVLRLDDTSSTQTVAQALLAGIQHTGGIANFASASATPPALGTNAVYYAITGSAGSDPVTGGVIAWQQGPVLAVVFAAGVDIDPDVVTLAQMQEQKLAAALSSGN
jgi:hypothetical protein